MSEPLDKAPRFWARLVGTIYSQFVEVLVTTAETPPMTQPCRPLRKKPRSGPNGPSESIDGSQARGTSFKLAGYDFIVLSEPVDSIAHRPRLTDAERELVSLVALGDSNKGIADKRGVSPHTVANQLREIYRKLGVTSRSEMVVRFRASSRT